MTCHNWAHDPANNIVGGVAVDALWQAWAKFALQGFHYVGIVQ